MATEMPSNEIAAAQPASASRIAPLGLGLLGAVLGLIGLSFVVRAVPGAGSVEEVVWPGIADTILVATLLAVGVTLRIRRPDHPIGGIFLALGLVAAASEVAWGYMELQEGPTGDPFAGQVSSWLLAILTGPLWSLLIAQLVIRFPSGSPATAGEARALRLAPLTSIAGGVLIGLRPGPMLGSPQFSNPLPIPESLAPVLNVTGVLGLLIAILPVVYGVAAMVRRYRAAAPEGRLQLRWFAWAASLALTTGLLYLIVGVVLNPDRPLIREGTFAVFVVAVTSLPLAVLVATSRYRLYDIDELIGRTVAYGALTAVLAGLYAASVRLFNYLFVSVTGQGSETALVLTTLVLATTFTPIKGYLERAAARRFPPTVPIAADVVLSPTGAPLPSLDGQALTTALLDSRIEAVARRVAAEVLAERRR